MKLPFFKEAPLMEPFEASSPGRMPMYNYACTHLQETCYEDGAKGNSRWWTGPKQMVYWVNKKWSCEDCARRAGVLW